MANAGSALNKSKRKFFDPTYVRHERRRSTVLACLVLWSVVMFFIVRFYLLGSVVVQGNSMLPTLWPGDRHLVHRWVLMLRKPKRGEIVVIKDPVEKGLLSVKRVVALPGETIAVRDRSVYVNDVLLEEPYLPAGAETPALNLAKTTYRIEKGHYFVMGDNRFASEDSRSFGAVARRDILGKIRRAR